MIQKNRFGKEWYIREGTCDENIIHEVFTDISYDFSWIKEEIKTVVDIGAHIGSFTVKAKKHFPESKVYSYEVDEDNFYLLEQNTKDLDNIKIENVAVYGYKKPSIIPTSKDNKNTGSVVLQYTTSEVIYPEEGMIKHISNIQYETDFIDLLKIDCEGGENSILPHLDFSKINYLYMELHSYSNELGMDETVEFLKANGMNILWMQKCNESIYNIIAQRRK